MVQRMLVCSVLAYITLLHYLGNVAGLFVTYITYTHASTGGPPVCYIYCVSRRLYVHDGKGTVISLIADTVAHFDVLILEKIEWSCGNR